MKLWMRVLIGLLLGLFVGWLIGDRASYLKFLGDIFMSLINMLVVLLVFSSMTVGITSIHDPKKLGRVGVKTLGLYVMTTTVAVALGIGFAYLLNPGMGVPLPRSGPIEVREAGSVWQMITDAVPRNPIRAMVEPNILQVIVFSIFLGLSINFCGEKARPLLRVISGLAETMYRMTGMVMEFAPIGVFAIMAGVTGTYGLKILLPLGKFLLANYLACGVQLVFVFGGILVLFARVNPLPFFRGMVDAIMVAFSTNSSSATLPVSMHCVQENLGMSKSISSFVLPLGATVNMNGAAIFQGICAVFISQAYGIDLGWQALLTVVVTATLSAVGAAGIPGSSLVMLLVVLESVGLPTEGLAIIAGIDRIREMGSTVINVLGDAVVGVYVAKSEGELDLEQYNHGRVVGYEESDV